MGNDELYLLNDTKQNCGETIFKDALQMTTDDIKFNRIGFGKKTNSKEFMTIFFRSVDICSRY